MHASRLSKCCLLLRSLHTSFLKCQLPPLPAPASVVSTASNLQPKCRSPELKCAFLLTGLNQTSSLALPFPTCSRAWGVHQPHPLYGVLYWSRLCRLAGGGARQAHRLAPSSGESACWAAAFLPRLPADRSVLLFCRLPFGHAQQRALDVPNVPPCAVDL